MPLFARLKCCVDAEVVCCDRCPLRQCRQQVLQIIETKTTQRSIQSFLAVLGVAVVYVLVDFAIDIRPPAVQSSYHFKIESLTPDVPAFLRQDNLVIVVIARSAASIAGLKQADANLQDPESRLSHQPAFATNALRSRQASILSAMPSGLTWVVSSKQTTWSAGNL